MVHDGEISTNYLDHHINSRSNLSDRIRENLLVASATSSVSRWQRAFCSGCVLPRGINVVVVFDESKIPA